MISVLRIPSRVNSNKPLKTMNRIKINQLFSAILLFHISVIVVLPRTSNVNFFIINSAGKLPWVVMICHLHLTDTSASVFRRERVKLLRQMNDLYQWCGQILETKFLSLSLLTFGEPISFSFWRMESGCIRASKGVFALRELPNSKRVIWSTVSSSPSTMN